MEITSKNDSETRIYDSEKLLTTQACPKYIKSIENLKNLKSIA